jgi:hypothetical protein
MRQIHHPLWFWIIGIVIFFPAAIIGTSLATPRAVATAVN